MRLLTLAAAATAAIAPVALADGIDATDGVGLEYARAPGVQFAYADGDAIPDVIIVSTGDMRATADLDTGAFRPSLVAGPREIAFRYTGAADDDAFLTPDAGVSVSREHGLFVVNVVNPSSRDLAATQAVAGAESPGGHHSYPIGASTVCDTVNAHPCVPRAVGRPVPDLVLDAEVPDAIATVNAPSGSVPVDAADVADATTTANVGAAPPRFVVADAAVPTFAPELAPANEAITMPAAAPPAAGPVPVVGSSYAPGAGLRDSWVRGTAIVAGSLVLVVPFLAWLFNRMHSPGAYLEDPSRARVYEVIQDKPGLTASDVARFTGVHRTTAEYHARRLQQAGYVSTVREGGVNRYFASAVGGDAPLRVAVCLVRYDPLRRILEWLAPDRTAPARDLAVALAVSRRAVRYHLQRLTEAGLVTREADARQGEVLRLTELGRRALVVASAPATGAAPAAQGLSAPLP